MPMDYKLKQHVKHILTYFIFERGQFGCDNNLKTELQKQRFLRMLGFLHS